MQVSVSAGTHSSMASSSELGAAMDLVRFEAPGLDSGNQVPRDGGSVWRISSQWTGKPDSDILNMGRLLPVLELAKEVQV